MSARPAKMKLRHMEPVLLRISRLQAAELKYLEARRDRLAKRGRKAEHAKAVQYVALAEGRLRETIRRMAAETVATKRGAGGRRSGQHVVEIHGVMGHHVPVPDSAMAPEVWALHIPQRMKEVGSELSAIVHELSAVGVKAMDPARVKVDGSPVGEGSGARASWLWDRADRAARALREVPAMSAVRTMQGDHRLPIAATVAVRMICVDEQSLCAILAKHGWTRSGGNKRRLRDLIEQGLAEIEASWQTARAA